MNAICTRRQLQRFVSSPVTRFILVALFATAFSPIAAHAQNLCSDNPPHYPCMNQPKEGDKEISGLLAADAAHSPSPDDVSLTASGLLPLHTPTVKAGTAEFSFPLTASLGPSGTATVSIAGGGSSGAVVFPPASSAGKICDSGAATSGHLCLNLPHSGETSVSGSLGAKSSPGAALTVALNGTVQTDADVSIKSDGSFTVSNLPKLTANQTVVVNQTSPAPAAGASAPTTGSVKTVDSNSKGSTTVISIAGWEQAGYSSLGQNGNPFISFFIDGPNDRRFSGWGRVRLLSSPQPSTQGIASTFTDPTGQITTKSFANVGQAMDFLVGPRFSLGTKWSVIADFGATTPLSSQNVAVSYAVPAQGTNECSTLASRFSSQSGYNPGLVAAPAGAGTCLVGGYKDIAFSNQDRSNFLLKYGGGFRTSSLIPCLPSASSKTSCSPSYGALDITLGQDESVTGGKLRSVVFKLDGVLPISTGNSAWIYLFGSVYMRLNRNQDLSPLILQTATGLTIPSPSVFVLPLRQPNRDYYRLGVGINLSQVFCKIGNAASCPNDNKATKSESAKAL